MSDFFSGLADVLTSEPAPQPRQDPRQPTEARR